MRILYKLTYIYKPLQTKKFLRQHQYISNVLQNFKYYCKKMSLATLNHSDDKDYKKKNMEHPSTDQLLDFAVIKKQQEKTENKKHLNGRYIEVAKNK